MKEKPIIFSGPMVKAIFEGRKSQTRRVVSGNPHLWTEKGPGVWSISTGRGKWTTNERFEVVTNVRTGATTEREYLEPFDSWMLNQSPFKVGQRLWVKEKWRPVGHEMPPTRGVHFAADFDEYTVKEKGPWKSPLHLPRIHSRLALEITEVVGSG